MKKKIIIVFAIVSVIILGFLAYNIDNQSDDPLSDNPVQVGSKILKEKFPNDINRKSKFIAYNYNNVWHVQNVFPSFDARI